FGGQRGTGPTAVQCGCAWKARTSGIRCGIGCKTIWSDRFQRLEAWPAVAKSGRSQHAGTADFHCPQESRDSSFGGVYDRTLRGDPAQMKKTCELCPHRCELEEGQTGFCRARQNQGGRIISINYGKVTALALDPIEKKPLR